MRWDVEIILKSNKKIELYDLISINVKSGSDSSVSKSTDFESFHLIENQKLSFVGKSQIVTLNSNEIEYVSLQRVS